MIDGVEETTLPFHSLLCNCHLNIVSNGMTFFGELCSPSVFTIDNMSPQASIHQLPCLTSSLDGTAESAVFIKTLRSAYILFGKVDNHWLVCEAIPNQSELTSNSMLILTYPLYNRAVNKKTQRL